VAGPFVVLLKLKQDGGGHTRDLLLLGENAGDPSADSAAFDLAVRRELL
jgi:hypothetical protein